MKILIASDLHWPTKNGVATAARTLAQGLASRGHEVLVIAPSQTGKPYKEVDENHIVMRTAAVPFPFYQNFRISVTPQREVKKIFNDFDPDVVHIEMMLGIGQAVMKCAKKQGVPIISTVHAIPENLLDNLKMLAPVARPIRYMLIQYGMKVYGKSDYLTVPTRSAIDMLKAKERVNGLPIEPVSNGINLSRFTPTKPDAAVLKKFGIKTDLPIVAYIGRLDAEKHMFVLLQAFARVVKKHPARLLIVGDGTDVVNLKNLAYELGIFDQTIFTGRVTDEELVELHKVGTVYCMPSPAELQSIATLEAMASGQPIVAVDAGALNELCQDKRNGFLCEKDNDKQMADGITKIISDSKLHDEFSRESLAIAKTHDINHTLERYEQIYQSLIKS